MPVDALTVCAVLRSSPEAALYAQTRAPERRVVADAGESWAAVLERLRGDDADWLWLLDDGVVPEPSALEELLAPLAEPADLPAPVLLSSKVVTPAGELDAERAPWIPLLDRDSVIVAATHRLAALRLARWGSLLVRRDALAEHLPYADYAGGADDLEWTGRLLRDAPGYLVPRSVAVRRERGDDPLRQLHDRARMVRGAGWVAHEPLWFAFILAADIAREARSRPRDAGRLLRAVGSGLTAR